MTARIQDDTALLVGRGDEGVRLISYLLKKLGLSVLDSPDVESALGLLQQTEARVRLAIVDEGGRQEETSSFLNRLHAVAPSISILLVSDRPQGRGQIPNVSRYLTKQFAERLSWDQF